MASIFSRIAAGEIPCHKIAETEQFLAFLDISPVAKGHTLVIPKQETDYIFDLEDELLAGLHIFSKKVAKAIEKVVSCERIATAVVGLEVPHAHIHLIPINSMADMNFANKKNMSQEELAQVAEQIRQQL
ncbi:MAG: HIT family protein [Raineya sp.]|jgi:histidine triad (HIT) family protein|nr:HIT family protein [Raineya sp.]